MVLGDAIVCFSTLTVFSVIFCVSIKMGFYEPRLDVMGWFYSHFEQSYMKGREDKTLKTQERQIRSVGGGGQGPRS